MWDGKWAKFSLFQIVMIFQASIDFWVPNGTLGRERVNPCPARDELTRFRFHVSHCQRRVYSFLIYAHTLSTITRLYDHVLTWPLAQTLLHNRAINQSFFWFFSRDRSHTRAIGIFQLSHETEAPRMAGAIESITRYNSPLVSTLANILQWFISRKFLKDLFWFV